MMHNHCWPRISGGEHKQTYSLGSVGDNVQLHVIIIISKPYLAHVKVLKALIYIFTEGLLKL